MTTVSQYVSSAPFYSSLSLCHLSVSIGSSPSLSLYLSFSSLLSPIGLYLSLSLTLSLSPSLYSFLFLFFSLYIYIYIIFFLSLSLYLSLSLCLCSLLAFLQLLSFSLSLVLSFCHREAWHSLYFQLSFSVRPPFSESLSLSPSFIHLSLCALHTSPRLSICHWFALLFCTLSLSAIWSLCNFYNLLSMFLMPTNQWGSEESVFISKEEAQLFSSVEWEQRWTCLCILRKTTPNFLTTLGMQVWNPR